MYVAGSDPAGSNPVDEPEEGKAKWQTEIDRLKAELKKTEEKTYRIWPRRFVLKPRTMKTMRARRRSKTTGKNK